MPTDDKNFGQENNLDFDDAKNMTIEEAVRKDSEIKAGVTKEDSILDKYIKQHREEVAAEKFETKLSDFEDLDTRTLDDFIKKQREELVTTGLIDESVKDEKFAAQADSEEGPDSESNLDETIIAAPISESLAQEIPESKAEDAEEESFVLGNSRDSRPFYKNKGLVIGGLLALALVIIGIAYGLNYMNSGSKTTTSSSSTSKTSSSSANNAKKDAKTFEELYDAFFTDDERTKLDNDKFDSLSELEAALAKLEGTAYYDEAKEKFDTLNAQIVAIKAVNDLFETEPVVDGEKISATVKADANFDDLPSSTLNTGNVGLDNLLQSVISEGRSQLQAKASSGAQAPANNTAAGGGAASGQTEAASNGQVPSKADPISGGTVSVASGYGITNYDPSTLQRHLSRVPYNESAIADSGNPAWVFADGVLEKIIATSQARGYFSGHEFILEKVNIINGNGYYNMFKADGTYLFSINCKTGYFVGNAAGNADDLDY